MKIAIVGSRDWGFPEMIQAYIQSLPKDTIIVSGHARGVDRMAETFAREAGLQVISIPADWDRLGRQAGFLRNTEIVNTCDKLVAFWDGQSKGTKDSIQKAMAMGKLDRVIATTKDGRAPGSDFLRMALGMPRLAQDERIPGE